MEYPSKKAYVRIFYKIATCNDSAIRGWFWREHCRQQVRRLDSVSSLSANYLAGYRDTSLPINRPNNWCHILCFPHFVMFSKHFSPLLTEDMLKANKSRKKQKKSRKNPNGNRKKFTHFFVKETEKTGKKSYHMDPLYSCQREVNVNTVVYFLLWKWTSLIQNY